MDNAATRSIINLHPWLHIRPKLSLLLKPTTTSTSKSENMNSTTMKETKTDVARTNTAYKLFSSSHFKSQSSLFDQTSTSSNGSLNTSSPPSVVSTTGTITNSSMKLVMLNNVKDTMFNVYNTTAGEITSGFYSMSTSHSYSLQHAMDNQTSTSYFTDESMDGINSGFIVIPAIYNAIVACAIRFATGNRTSMYDPIPVTLERSEDIDIDTLLYNNT